MKKIAILVILVAGQYIAIAQNPTKNLSLDEAITFALNNRSDLQANNYNTLIAQNNIDRSKSEFIPDVSFSANVRYNALLQGTLIPAGFGGLPEPKILSLGAKNVTAFSLDISEPIYRPTLKTELSLADVNLQVSKENKALAENAVKTKIAEAYYNVILKKLQWTLLGNVKKRFAEYVDITAGKFKNGTILESEYLKAKLDVDNADIEMVKAEQSWKLSMSYLKYLMNMPSEAEIVLTDSLSLGGNVVSIGQSYNINRPEMRLYDLQRQTFDLLTKKTKEGFLPTVSAYGNFSTQFLYNNFNYAKWDYWNPYSFVGVRLGVPLSAKFKSKEILKDYALKRQQSELEKSQKDADIHFEIEKAQTDMANALLNIKSSKMSYDLSKEIYGQQIQQFALGGLLYSNILETERSLNTAEQNYIKSVYDYYISKIGLSKATGVYE